MAILVPQQALPHLTIVLEERRAGGTLASSQQGSHWAQHSQVLPLAP